MNLCRDCRHRDHLSLLSDKCRHAYASDRQWIDPVDGRSHKPGEQPYGIPCAVMRMNRLGCGPEGKLWEPKPAAAAPLARAAEPAAPALRRAL